MAWAEDRALLGSNPSADSGAEMGRGRARLCPCFLLAQATPYQPGLALPSVKLACEFLRLVDPSGDDSKVKTQSYIYELRVTLQEIQPPIWRLIQVPSTSPLCCLHDVLQVVMGWTNSHLHQFEKDGKYWGVPEHFEEGDIDILDEGRAKISDLLKEPGDSVLYVYDLGDDWRHEMVLEKILPTSETTARPLCLSGERHCPPEDVGGTAGYEEFLEVIFDPHHKEYEHNVRWAGGPSALTQSVERFQPEEFDAQAVNATLSRMRWPARRRQ